MSKDISSQLISLTLGCAIKYGSRSPRFVFFIETFIYITYSYSITQELPKTLQKLWIFEVMIPSILALPEMHYKQNIMLVTYLTSLPKHRRNYIFLQTCLSYRPSKLRRHRHISITSKVRQAILKKNINSLVFWNSLEITCQNIIKVGVYI